MNQSDLDNIVYNMFTNGDITLSEYIKYQNRDKIMNNETITNAARAFADFLEKNKCEFLIVFALPNERLKGEMYVSQSNGEKVTQAVFNAMKNDEQVFTIIGKAALAAFDEQPKNLIKIWATK